MTAAFDPLHHDGALWLQFTPEIVATLCGVTPSDVCDYIAMERAVRPDSVPVPPADWAASFLRRHRTYRLVTGRTDIAGCVDWLQQQATPEQQ